VWIDDQISPLFAEQGRPAVPTRFMVGLLLLKNRGHQTASPRRVFLSGQQRGVFGTIKRELRRRSAIEAVIAHLKNDGHLGRCFLKGWHGNAANVVLSAV
jgi:hypothetical protein